MPLYEYACPTCSECFELLIRPGEKPACPDCGSTRLEKQLSVPAAHTANSASLPVCQPHSSGGCGAPWCGTGGCGM